MQCCPCVSFSLFYNCVCVASVSFSGAVKRCNVQTAGGRSSRCRKEIHVYVSFAGIVVCCLKSVAVTVIDFYDL
jgi:hypothetical protein